MPKHFTGLWVKILDNMKRLYDIISPRHEWFKYVLRFSQIICALLIFFCAHYRAMSAELPDLGNSASAILTPQQEYELGHTVVKELQAALMISNDMIVNEYLQSVGYRLVATHGHVQANYQFFTVNDNTINAFALPGGFIGVNTGLILATESESELAGVLAHEVGHVQQKHIARMYEHMGRLRLSTIAGMIAAIILSTQNAQAGTGAMAAALASSQQALINFTRDHEKEADYVGIHSLTSAGYDPMGMPAFFHRMSQDNRNYGNRIPEYLQTHPLTENRLMAAHSRAQSFPYKQVPDSLQYHLIQARVRLHSFSTPSEASTYFAKLLAHGNYRNRLGVLYGYSLSLIEEGKAHQAKPYLDELLQAAPNQPLFHLAYAQMELNTQQPQQALNRLANTLKNHPSNYPLMAIYSEWLIKLGEPRKAILLLKQHTSHKTTHNEVWHLLSAAYARANEPAKAHLAQAQYLKRVGDFKGAATQLTLAKKITSLSTQDKQQIDTELKEVQAKITS